MRPKRLELADVEFIAFQLAKRLMEWDEPIPSFGTRFPDILESCISQPFQRIAGKFAYPGLFRKAAVQFYRMIKNHPFQNGNKRIAITTLFVFLGNHGYWITVDNESLYQFARMVAESDPSMHHEITDQIEKFIRENIGGVVAPDEEADE